MTMRLKRIELENIRSHKHVVFEPEQTGVTAIKGATGAGKSTIVDTVPWVLFGEKPQGVSRTVEIYRNGATFPEDKCSARVDMSLNGKDYIFTRRFVSKGGAVECTVETEDENGSLEIVAGPSVSHAEDYIRRLLQMGSKGFMSAVFVQQKQVDNLISASPRERGEIIEKLTGIHGLTHSLTFAREEAGSLKKAVALSTVDSSTISELEADMEAVDAEVTKREEMAAKAKKRSEEASEKLAHDEEKVSKLRTEIHRRDAIESRLEFITEHCKQVEGSLESLESKRSALRKRYLEMSGVGDADKVRASVSKLKAELSAAQKDSYRASSTLDTAKSELEATKTTISDSEFSNKTAAKTKLKSLQGELTDTRASQDAAATAESDAQAEERSLRGAKKALERGEGTCPTCLQTAHDPEAALRDIDERLKAAHDAKSAGSATKKASESKIADLEESIADAERIIAAYDRSKELTAQIKDLKSQVSTAESEVKVVSKKVDSAEQSLRLIQQAETIKSDLDEATEALETAISESTKYKKEIEDLKKERDGLTSTSSDTLKKMEGSLTALRERSRELSEGILKIEGRLSVLAERRSSLSKSIENEKANLERYEELLKSYEESEASVSTISEFRQDRIDNAVPTIEGLASELLERFTDGLFTTLRIDSKFRVRVTRNDAATFSVGLLSGGELSAAAMALRLAIGMLLSPGNARNLLILDEVLTAQDSARSELILNSIRELYDGQVIIIAHNDSIDAIVDSTFTVEK